MDLFKVIRYDQLVDEEEVPPHGNPRESLNEVSQTEKVVEETPKESVYCLGNVPGENRVIKGGQ